jgi:predicted DNA-binding protein (MmcQ/YjbR family)
MTSASQTIRTTVAAWPGLAEASHRFGGVEFKIGKREIGHLHGDTLLDVPFPKKVRDDLVAAGRADPHHILPQSGWISFRIRSTPDVDAAVALLRQSYDLITEQVARRKVQSDAAAARRTESMQSVP